MESPLTKASQIQSNRKKASDHLSTACTVRGKMRSYLLQGTVQIKVEVRRSKEDPMIDRLFLREVPTEVICPIIHWLCEYWADEEYRCTQELAEELTRVKDELTAKTD